MILSVYGGHLHSNYFTHLDGVVAGDAMWQSHWRHIRNLPMMWHDVPQGRIGRRFVQRLESELKGVRTRGFNYEHPLVFAAVILSMAENDRSPKDIHSRIDHRMDLWGYVGSWDPQAEYQD